MVRDNSKCKSPPPPKGPPPVVPTVKKDVVMTQQTQIQRSSSSSEYSLSVGNARQPEEEPIDELPHWAKPENAVVSSTSSSNSQLQMVHSVQRQQVPQMHQPPQYQLTTTAENVNLISTAIHEKFQRDSLQHQRNQYALQWVNQQANQIHNTALARLADLDNRGLALENQQRQLSQNISQMSALMSSGMPQQVVPPRPP